MHFQSVDRIPHMEFGYWAETWDRWHKEGLPEDLVDHGRIEKYFGCEHFRGLPIQYGIHPVFESKVLEEKGDTRIIQNAEGIIQEVNTVRGQTIPHYLEFPIKDRKSWESFKERLDPNDPIRRPESIKELAEGYRNSDQPIAIGINSLFGRLRNWTGFEGLAMLVYDDRDLVEEMVEHMCQMTLDLIEPWLKEVEVDAASGWEDICFNQGPMISPTHFKEILYPRYKRVADMCRRHGVSVIFTDCDGDITPIVPIWLDAGYNCMFPVEVHAGSDPVAMRKEHGKELLLIGGYDKRKMMSKKDILDEWKRLEPVVAEGGFIPHVDHRVPADVSFEMYKYYMKCKKDIFGIESIPEEIVSGQAGERC